MHKNIFLKEILVCGTVGKNNPFFLKKSSLLGKEVRMIAAPWGLSTRASRGPRKYHSVLLGWVQNGGKLAKQEGGTKQHQLLK